MKLHECPNCGGHDDDDAIMPPRRTNEKLAEIATKAFFDGANPMTRLGIDTSGMEQALYDVNVYRVMIEMGLEFHDWDDKDLEGMRRQLRLVVKVADALNDFLSMNDIAVTDQRDDDGN